MLLVLKRLSGQSHILMFKITQGLADLCPQVLTTAVSTRCLMSSIFQLP